MTLAMQVLVDSMVGNKDAKFERISEHLHAWYATEGSEVLSKHNRIGSTMLQGGLSVDKQVHLHAMPTHMFICMPCHDIGTSWWERIGHAGAS